jgi:hypothetical protein
MIISSFPCEISKESPEEEHVRRTIAIWFTFLNVDQQSENIALDPEQLVRRHALFLAFVDHRIQLTNQQTRLRM